MVVYHIVSFSSSTPEGIAALTSGALALPQGCTKPSGETYIRSVKCGKQISTEDNHRGMQLVFVMEFDNDEDLQYYLWKDPYHTHFKTQVAKPHVSGVVCLDFEDGQF